MAIRASETKRVQVNGVLLTEDLHAWVKAIAKTNERSMIREIAAQLRGCKERDEAANAPQNFMAH